MSLVDPAAPGTGEVLDASTPRPLAIDAVLFDLDGTLVDTAPDLCAALNRVRVARGLPQLPIEALRPYASHGARGLIGAGFDVAPDHAGYVELRDAFLDQYAGSLCVDSAVFDAVEDVLDAIEERGLAWGIVTNKATRYTLPLLEALGLAARAQVIVCGDTTPHAKPHPAPLLAAAERLGVPPARCLYVGDAERDVAAGIAAGMLTVVARYGYIAPHETPDTWPAHAHVVQARDLIAWLP
jgi:N-acetyl-D-muramate 6-phosphate phosphatase